MGKIIKKRIEYGGSSNSAENIKYDDTKNVKEAINEVKSEITDVNGKLQYISNNVDISNGIDLITYTDKNNPYICQTDGLIQCASSGTYNTKYYINLHVNDFMVFSLKGNGAESSSMTWRVFKGDKIYVTMNNYSGTYGPWVTLYPLK